jgi:hypothetical protein
MYFPSPRGTERSVSIYHMNMAHCWYRTQVLLERRGKDAVADYISRLSKSEAAPDMKRNDTASKHDASP